MGHLHFKLARHAQPEKNYTKDKLVNNGLKLGKQGFLQAIALGLTTKEASFDVILSGSLVRASQTAQTVRSVQGNVAELIIVPELNEVNFGESTRDDLKQWIEFGSTSKGETVSQARKRVRKAIEIMKEYDGNILVVAHKLLYSVFLLEFEGHPDDTPVSQLKENKLLDYAECVELPL